MKKTNHTELDERKLHDYWHTYYSIDYQNLEQQERLRLLQNADIMTPGEDGELISIGGMLIFGKNPQRRIPQSSIIFAVFDGQEITNNLLDKHEILGTLPELINQTSAKIQIFLPRPSTISGLQRQEHPAIPTQILAKPTDMMKTGEKEND